MMKFRLDDREVYDNASSLDSWLLHIMRWYYVKAVREGRKLEMTYTFDFSKHGPREFLPRWEDDFSRTVGYGDHYRYAQEDMDFLREKDNDEPNS